MTSTTSTEAWADTEAKASAAVPLLREHAVWNEQNRRLHDDVLEALRDAGVFRMRVAARYGGSEADAGTLLRTVAEIARGDGSAAWLTSVWSICAWLTGLFPDAVQDEVFADPDTRVCGVLSPTASAEPADGGIVIDGRWQFISGARHSQWQLVLAMAPTPDGSARWPVMALVPMPDLTIVDDWYTSGLCGTGSVSTVARQLFVPSERVLPMPAILQGQYATVANADSPIFQAPMMVTGCLSFAGTAAGLARAARENFLERLPQRKITYTDYAAQRDAPLTHLQLAEATLKAEEAEFHAARLAATVDAHAATRQPWTLLDRVEARAALGRVFQLAKESADILTTASGGSSIYTSVPIQRVARDLQALNLHALMHPDTNLELYGRVLCGLEPNTMYL